MLHFCSILIGEDYNYTVNFQPSSKRKLILMGTCMLIPVILWFITGFLTSRMTMNHSFGTALAVGFIAAFIVFLIERSIILSNGGWLIFIFRILLGFIIASLGAITLDSAIFKSDIDNKVNWYASNHLDSIRNSLQANYLKNIEDKKQLLELSYDSWIDAERNYKDEMQGKKGNSSGTIGNGDIAKQLRSLSEKANTTYLSQKSELNQIELSKNLKIEKKILEAKANFNTDGLLIRIKALHDLILEDKNLKKVYWLFTAFIFLLEFIVIVAKTGSKKSIDEEIEMFRDLSTATKLKHFKKLLQNKDQSLRYLPQIAKAHDLLDKPR